MSAAEIGMLLALAAGVCVDSHGPTRCALVAAVLMILGYTAWAVTATESSLRTTPCEIIQIASVSRV